MVFERIKVAETESSYLFELRLQIGFEKIARL